MYADSWSLHNYGQANHVVFDAGTRQSIDVRTNNLRESPANVLHVDFDSKLVVSTAAYKCVNKAACGMSSLVKIRKFYPMLNLLYLVNVMSY